ncbi:MAG: MFS transporter [Acidobacteriota bacterium]
MQIAVAGNSPMDNADGSFRGWWMVLVAMVGLGLCLGTTLHYTFGVFAKPLGEVFGVNRGSIALSIAIMNIMVTLCSPLMGRLSDRFGGRRVIGTAIIGNALCIMGMSFLEPPLWHLYALYALAGVTGAGAAPVTYARVVASWFDRKRGLALGLANVGIGVGAFVMPSLAQFLIDEAGWRRAYLVIGILPLALAAPLVWFFFGEMPREERAAPEPLRGPGPGEGAAAAGMTLREALRTRTFWLLCGVFGGVSACANGVIAHLVPMLTDQGITARDAALATSMFGAATIVGRVGAGYLVDRFFAPRVAALLFAGAVAGLAVLWKGGLHGIAIYIPAGLIGLTLGAEGDVMPFLVSRYFGMRSMGALFGIAFGFYTLGAASGQYLFGVGFDATGSYRFPLACGMGVLLVSILGALGLGQYRRAEGGAVQ